MAEKITVRAAAKLNLSLEVVGTRSDGYHLLRSVMQSVTLFNTLEIEKSDRLTLWCDDAALPTDAKNTAFRAAQLFFEEAKISGGAALRLFKKIPYQAGMGSASADAAAALLGLNRLFDAPLSQNQLLTLGEKIGADVPFAMTGGTQLAEGIGERLTPLNPLPDCGIVVLFSAGQGMSTPEAYRRLDALAQGGKKAPLFTEGMLAAVAAGNVLAVAQSCGNVFAQVCQPEKTQQAILQLAQKGALGASLTGSGSAVFGIFEDVAAAERAAQGLVGSFVCRPCQNSIQIDE